MSQTFSWLLFPGHPALVCGPASSPGAAWCPVASMPAKDANFLNSRLQGCDVGRGLFWSSPKRPGYHCAGTKVSLTQKDSLTRMRGSGVWWKRVRQPLLAQYCLVLVHRVSAERWGEKWCRWAPVCPERCLQEYYLSVTPPRRADRYATGSLQMAISTLPVTGVFACLFCRSRAEPSGL